MDETQNVPCHLALITNVMLYLVVVTWTTAHHVHVHRDIQEHAKKTITVHVIKVVHHTNRADIRIPPMPARHIIQTVVHILQHVQHTVTPAAIHRV